MIRTIEALALSFVIAMAGVAFSFAPIPAATAGKGFGISMAPIGSYHSGIFNEGGAEIVAHDPETQRVFTVNAGLSTVDVLDISDPSSPAKIMTIDISPYGDSPNSVAVHNGVVAVAVANPSPEEGAVAFFDADGNFISSVAVGAGPDMLTFTPNGQRVLVANEGEPADYCAPGLDHDPEGSVSIIDVRGGVEDLSQSDVTTATFTQFNDAALDASIRIFGPNATVAQDLEPEYITVSHDSKTAWVVLQENNAIATLDIKKGKFTDIFGLGFKDHSLAGNGIDASDRDDTINIANWPVKGVYMPDGIASYKSKGKTYLVTANEGDAREWDCYAEEARIKDLTLDPAAFPNASDLQEDENIGRLTVTTANGDANDDGMYEELYAFGARSFSIWDENGQQVFDSADDFEQITAEALPAYFNANHEDNSASTFDNRSDNKGPEPEGVVLGKVRGMTIAFVGLERIGGIMAYDITNPASPSFLSYANNRTFEVPADSPAAGDLGPEGLAFIKADDSPTGKPLLVVGNEVSGTTTIYEITVEK